MKSLIKKLIATLAVAGTISLIPATAFAQGEHLRRVASELLVMAGDMKRLASIRSDSKQAKGLRDRIGGGLAGLDLMRRLANQELGRRPSLHSAHVPSLRLAFNNDDPRHFMEIIENLISAYPFTATGILPARPTPLRLKSGRSLHEEHCAACHDDPVNDVERPAYNLFSEVKQLPPMEFAARMIVGVRGDRMTGIDNPLTDEQIASLIAFYVTR